VHFAPFSQASHALEAASRTFVTHTLGQPQWVAQFDAWNSQPHPHSADFPFMRAFDVFLMGFLYLFVVFVGVPLAKLLLPGDGFSLRPMQIVHNLVLVVLSLYMMLEALNQAWRTGYTVFGNGVNPTPAGRGMARILWLFFASKVIEFNDTFIMILRKSFRQVTFLHVYHHYTIFTIWWATTHHAPGGDGYFCVVLNSGVHVVMYAYYLSVSMGVPLNSIKPYITLMQMTQFVAMLTNSVYNIIWPAPGYPYYLYVMLFFYMISLLTLFGNFYIQSYTRKPAASSDAKKRQ